jgi:hypothetical protein
MILLRSKEHLLGNFYEKILIHRTDRILWSSDTGVKQRYYGRRESLESDHRPVVGYFIVPVKKVDRAKRDEVIKSLYKVIISNLFEIFRKVILLSILTKYLRNSILNLKRYWTQEKISLLYQPRLSLKRRLKTLIRRVLALKMILQFNQSSKSL